MHRRARDFYAIKDSYDNDQGRVVKAIWAWLSGARTWSMLVAAGDAQQLARRLSELTAPAPVNDRRCPNDVI